MTGDDSVYTMTVQVNDMGGGELGFTVVYTKGDETIDEIPVFNNIYEATGSTSLVAKKLLNGRELNSGEFNFQLKQLDGPNADLNNQVLETKANGRAAEGNNEADPAMVDFTTLTYDQTSINETWTYEISEVAPTESGMTGDDTVYTVKVAVTDAGNGQLNVVETYWKGDTAVAAPVVFANGYEAIGTWAPYASKELNGRELMADEFSFQLKQINGPDADFDDQVLENKTNGREASGDDSVVLNAIDFSLLTYDQTSINQTYFYEVSEVKPSGDDAEGGMTYDDSVYTATVEVTDAREGQLNVSVTWTDASDNTVEYPVFNNTYRASGSLIPTADVDLSGREPTAGEFNFTWTQVNGPDPDKNGEVLQTKPNGREGDEGDPEDPTIIDFDPINFTQDDIGMTYTYQVTQVTPDEEGMTGDPTVYTATVVITDAGNGELNIVVTYNDGEKDIDGNPVFKPQYEATGSWTPELIKELDGRALTADEFSFTLKQVSGPDVDQEDTVLSTVTNSEDGSIVFTEISYDQTSINKTYTYEVSEVTPDEAETGMTYADTVYKATVEVTDAGNGKLNVDVTWTDADGESVETLTFNNTYRASGNVIPQATVTLTGRELSSGEFNFKLTQVQGPISANDGRVLETKVNGRAAEGGNPADPAAIDFSQLNYTQDDIGKTYTYEISEDTPTEGGMIGDASVYTMIVQVNDMGDGELGFTVVYKKGNETIDEIPVFNNIYKATGSTSLVAKKLLNGRELNSGEFNFQLKQLDGPDADLNNQVLETKANGRAAEGNNEADPAMVDFTTLTYDQTSINKTWTYEISEVAPTESGMTGDDTVYTVKVAVTDAGNGQLNVVETYWKGDTAVAAPVVFANGYEAIGTWAPYASKELDGRKLKVDEFNFQLKQITGPDATLDNQVLENKTNGRETSGDDSVVLNAIDFSLLTYDQTSINKTYVYEVSEVKPSGDDAEGGMTYDDSVYTATVEVTDAREGQLNVSVTWTDASDNTVEYPVFNNTYRASGSLIPTADVDLSGREPTAGEFNFTWTQVNGPDPDKNGEVLQTKPNGREGDEGDPEDPTIIDFDPINFTQDDIGKTYTYQVTQVTPDEEGMTGDPTVYTATVVITDAGNGELNIVVTYNDGEKDIEGNPVFKPQYEATGSWTPELIKELDGRALKADEFGFTLKQVSGPDVDQDDTVLSTVTNSEDGSIAFAEISYDQTSINKTYTYEVSEVTPDEAETGMTYADTVYKATVEVTDAGNGKLNVDVTWTMGDVELTEVPVFVNNYKASGSFTPIFKSTLTGRDMKENEFEFEFKQVTGPDADKNDTVISSVRNDADGNIIFDEQTYTEDDIGKTYVYEVYGKKPDDPESGLIYDNALYRITVTITDGGNGRLNVDVKYDKGDGSEILEPEFAFDYKASGNVRLTATKELKGRELIGGDFSFELKSIGDTPAVTQIKDNAADGGIVFESLLYTEADIGKTYEYEIREVVPAEADENMSYDETVYAVTVNIADAGDGELDVKISYSDGTNHWTADDVDKTMIFENIYTTVETEVTPPVKPESTKPVQTDKKTIVPRTGETATEVVVGAILILLALMVAGYWKKRRETED